MRLNSKSGKNICIALQISDTLGTFYSLFSIVLVYHTGTKIHFLYIYSVLIKLNESKIWIIEFLRQKSVKSKNLLLKVKKI